jgi:hypothetical protein
MVSIVDCDTKRRTQMHKFLPVAVLAFTVAASGAALASDDDSGFSASRDQWMTIPQVTEKLASQGYDVRQVRAEGGGYELYAVDKQGKRVEALVNPVTGEILRAENGSED